MFIHEIPVDQLSLNQLRTEVVKLRKEIDLLRMHKYLAQGMKGESLIAQLTDGSITTRNASSDVQTNGVRLEIKYSKLMEPTIGSTTRRWTWSKPLGYKDKGKDYDFLLLIGEKDQRYLSQYLDTTSPYCVFCIPIAAVPALLDKGSHVGGVIQCTTRFSSIRSPKSKELLKHMIPFDEIAAKFKDIKVLDSSFSSEN